MVYRVMVVSRTPGIWAEEEEEEEGETIFTSFRKRPMGAATTKMSSLDRWGFEAGLNWKREAALVGGGGELLVSCLRYLGTLVAISDLLDILVISI